MLELKNISKYYINNKMSNKVLEDISIIFKESSINTIIGNSGVGKTTLLNILGLIDSPTKGTMYLKGKLIDFDNDLSKTRLNKFGYVFQNHSLIPEYSIIENLILPNIINNISVKDAKQKAYTFLDKFSLLNIDNNYPESISAGECQRVAIIRSLMNDPEIIIADEPTSNLDEENAQLIIDFFSSLNNKNKYMFVIATHDKRFLKISLNNFKLTNKKLRKFYNE